MASILTDPKNLHGIERVAPAAKTAKHNETKSRSAGTQLESQKILNVVENALALFDGAEDCAEVVVGEDHICGLLGHVSSQFAHADSNICLLQSRSIVHTITSHGHNIATTLESVDDLKLVVRASTREDGDSVHAVRQLGLAHLIKLITSKDWRAKSRRHVNWHTEPLGDRNSSNVSITSDHDNFHTAG